MAKGWHDGDDDSSREIKLLMVVPEGVALTTEKQEEC